MDRALKAVEYKMNRHSCTEAVMLAYKDLVDLTDEQITKLASGFGTGMGVFESTCGALIGAVMILGMLNNTKAMTKTLAGEMLLSFKEMCGDTTCKVLKGIGTGKMLANCNDCVKNACIILDAKLKEIGVDTNA